MAFIIRTAHGLAFAYAARMTEHAKEYLADRFKSIDAVVEADYPGLKKTPGAYAIGHTRLYVLDLPFPGFTWAAIADEGLPKVAIAVDTKFPVDNVKDVKRKARRFISRIQEDWLYTELGLRPVDCKRDDLPNYFFL